MPVFSNFTFLNPAQPFSHPPKADVTKITCIAIALVALAMATIYDISCDDFCDQKDGSDALVV